MSWFDCFRTFAESNLGMTENGPSSRHLLWQSDMVCMSDYIKSRLHDT